jgi:hypothetical protein
MSANFVTLCLVQLFPPSFQYKIDDSTEEAWGMADERKTEALQLK